MITKIHKFLTENKFAVIAIIILGVFSSIYTFFTNSESNQGVINSPGSVVVSGDIYGDITTSVSTESPPKLEYKEVSSIKGNDGLYHTTYGLILSFINEKDLEKIEIIDLNPSLRCGELPKAHFGVWAGFPNPGWMTDHTCVSENPVIDNGELFTIRFKN